MSVNFDMSVSLEMGTSFAISYNLLIPGFTGKLESDKSKCGSLERHKMVLILMYLISLTFPFSFTLFEQFFLGTQTN